MNPSLARLLAVAFAVLAAGPAHAASLPGFHRGPWFDEQARELWVEPGVRVVVNAPADFDLRRPTRLVVYATPNGNTAEQTLGCGPADGLDWHFDIQHVAAQVRRLREASPGENGVPAVAEAEGLSWPGWRRNRPDAPAHVRRVVATLRWMTGGPARVTLAGHSGGGAFLFAYLEGGPVPGRVDGIAFLDANYSFEPRHGDTLLAWLGGGPARRLTVLAYDDRRVTLGGKPVVGPDGGTYRASQRMLAHLGKTVPFAESTAGDFATRRGLDGRVVFHVHANPENRILHTALVGEMNGLLEALAPGKPWGTFGGPRAYARWVQPAPGIPPRPADAPGGAAFLASLAPLSLDDREEAIAREIGRGNVPNFLRKFVPITIRDGPHAATIEVMPDYLAVGSDADFVRLPMTPTTAQRIADAFGCALPTRKVVDAVHRTAAVKLEPLPLTRGREAVGTFGLHHRLIELERDGYPLGELVAGVKKDIVVTNRLAERPARVAIYGWHYPDGRPIQPLTIVHWERYVDYSHGVRLMRRAVTVDGRPRDVRHLLHHPDWHRLLSDEGPVTRPAY